LRWTAKSCGPDIPTLISSLRGDDLADDGGKKARSPGRARRKPLKPLRREGRVFRRTCGDYARVLYFICTRGCGCGAHPAFPAPSVIRGHKFLHDSGALRRGKANVCLNYSRHCEERKRRPAVARFASYGALGVRRSVLARRRKQSILSLCGEMDCFAEPVIGRAFARPVGSQ
jgi:hypothetical protein